MTATLTPTPYIRLTISSWESELISHGAQAEVFRVKCGLDGVVVKRFFDSKHRSIKQEVAIIQDLAHKYIVQLYHVHHGMIAMEYVEGGTLAEAIVAKSLKSWEVKTRIAKDVSLGLAYLHSRDHPLRYQGLQHSPHGAQRSHGMSLWTYDEG